MGLLQLLQLPLEGHILKDGHLIEVAGVHCLRVGGAIGPIGPPGRTPI